VTGRADPVLHRALAPGTSPTSGQADLLLDGNSIDGLLTRLR
jgi:hypothetical protein